MHVSNVRIADPAAYALDEAPGASWLEARLPLLIGAVLCAAVAAALIVNAVTLAAAGPG